MTRALALSLTVVGAVWSAIGVTVAAAGVVLRRSEFPAVDQRHQVDQALATTRAVQS